MQKLVGTTVRDTEIVAYYSMINQYRATNSVTIMLLRSLS